MTDPTHYPVYPYKTLSCALLIIGLCLLNFPSMEAGMYPEGAFDFTTLGTKRTLEARHIIVGEVTHVSFVFELQFTGPEYGPDGWATSGPLSFVTVRVDKDLKKEIERVDNQETKPLEGKTSEKERETPPQTVTCVQVGGPYPLVKFLPFFEGGWTTAAGIPVLKRGERVFLRLIPTTSPVEHKGQTANSITHEFGTIYSVREEEGELDKHIIERGWRGMDVTVLQMTRIVRATLKQPERMRALERRVSRLKPMPIVFDVNGQPHRMQSADRLPIVMDEVRAIETELNLSPLCGSDGGKDD